MNITKGKIVKAQKFVIFGVEGIGKSSLVAQFPDPLFIDTEGSTNNMDVARFDKPTSWAMLQQQIDYVKLHKPCKTLAIDTIDWAESMLIQSMCAKLSADSIEAIGGGYGQGYVRLEEELGRFLNKLQDLIEIGINVVLVAHARIRKFDQPDETGSYDRYELKLGKKTTGTTAGLVKEWADTVLFCRYKTLSVATDNQGKKFKGQGGQRVMQTTYRPAWDAKNRFGLPDEIPLDFAAIAHIFNTIPTTTAVQSSTTKTAVQTPPVTTPRVVNDSPTTFDPSTIPPLQESINNPFPKETPTSGTASNVDYDGVDYVGIPQTLIDLMKVESVTAKEVMDATHQAYKGAFPQNMEFKNLPHDFINQALLPNWDKALSKIKENRITGGAY